MSKERFWNPDRAGKGLSHMRKRVTRTCPIQGPDMSEKCLCNPVTHSDNSGQKI
jgi:hypothetical protein